MLTHVLALLMGMLSFFQSSPVSQDQIKLLQNCKHDSVCLESFFKDYTAKNDLQKSILFFKNLTDKDPNLLSDCHYMFHGMGHGQLEKSSGDVGKSFSDFPMSNELLFKYTTCTNGYYHGVIEEYVGEVHEKKSLIEKLTSVCKNIDKENSQNQIDCYHGVGHAAFIQLNNNLKEAISVCDSVAPNDFLKGNCHTGVFMQATSDDDYINNVTDITPSSKIMDLGFCDSLKNEIYQAECYNQSSYLFADFFKDKDKFLGALERCNKIKDKVERVTCVRTSD